MHRYLTICVFIHCLSRSQVQRIVITSSCASVITELSEPTVFSERDWNLAVIEEIREMGNKSSPTAIYRASKTLAEKGEYFAFRPPGVLCLL